MASNYNTTISERDLDHLLGQAFLNLDFNDTKNEKMMEAIATRHLGNANTFGGLLKTIFLNVWVVAFISVAITGVLVLTYFTQEHNQANNLPEINVSSSDIPETPPVISGSSHIPASVNSESFPINSNGTIDPEKDPGTDAANIVFIEPNNANENNNRKNDPGYKNQPVDSAYVFPILTEEEIKINNKQKKKMIAALVKTNTEKYAYIPKGSTEYMGKTISVEAFHMQTTEVSNLEYRTFLHDLLIQGRKQDYRMAMPNHEMWNKKFTNSYNDPMAKQYFWHPAYDNYPVVNISRDAAKLYCKWLTDETNKILVENDRLGILVDLPTEHQWVYAALGGKEGVRYANAGTFLRNSKGCYEVNYLGYTMDECRYDSVANLYVPVVDKKTYFEDGGFYMVSTSSYFANPYGLYCMAGNVSEMIFSSDIKPATKGGSWFSCDYFLEIEARDEFDGETGPSPMIGFRPVVIGYPLKTH